MIEADEWKGSFYAWENIGFGFAMAAKSEVSIEDAKEKLRAGDAKELFIGILEPLEPVYYEAGGFTHMEYKDFEGIIPPLVEDKVVRSIAIKMERDP